MNDTARATGRGGFTLVESLVALVLIGVVLLALAPVLFSSARQQITNTAAAERSSVLLQEGNRLSSLPFNALAAQEGCKSLPPQARFSHERCVKLHPVSGTEWRVVVVVEPENPAIGADSLIFSRTRPRGNPFNTGQP